MSTIPISESFNLQDEKEEEVLMRLLNGESRYQQLIINHTSDRMFTRKENKDLYNLMIKFFNKNRYLNASDLIDSLKDKDIIHAQYILYLKKWYCCSADAINWINRLITAYEKRILTNCVSIEDYKKTAEEISKYRVQATECELLNTALDYINSYEKQANTMIKTGYLSIDKLIGGLQGGNYMILAGSTGMGKTAMALNLVVNMVKTKKNVLLLSLEMTAEELLSRIIASIMEISSENIRNRSLTQKEWDKYVAYTGSKDFEEMRKHITIPAKTNLDIGGIEEIVRNSSADIVFIDYLGLIRTDNIKANTYEQISDISRRIKLLAIETNKPIVVLHQLNRDMKDRQEKRPRLSDIRDSGKIEQDADFITFVFRPIYFDTEADKTAMEFIIGKARHTGGVGQKADLNFIGQYQKIIEARARFT